MFQELTSLFTETEWCNPDNFERTLQGWEKRVQRFQDAPEKPAF